MTTDEMMNSLRPRAVKAMQSLPFGVGFDEFARIVAAVHKAEVAHHRSLLALVNADDFLSAL